LSLRAKRSNLIEKRLGLPRCARNGGLPRSLRSLAMTIYCKRLRSLFRAKRRNLLCPRNDNVTVGLAMTFEILMTGEISFYEKA
jgi:hypothetical protein